jgi:hypothetical protein
MLQRRSVILIGLGIVALLSAGTVFALRSTSGYHPKATGIFGEEVVAMPANQNRSTAGTLPLTEPQVSTPQTQTLPKEPGPAKPKPKGKARPLYAFA